MAEMAFAADSAFPSCENVYFMCYLLIIKSQAEQFIRIFVCVCSYQNIYVLNFDDFDAKVD